MPKAFASRRQSRTRAIAHEQAPANLFLQRPYAGADRGLRQVQPIRRRHEAAGGDDLEEGAGQPDIHAATTTLLRLNRNSIRLPVDASRINIGVSRAGSEIQR